jgi:hypothetical protein
MRASICAVVAACLTLAAPVASAGVIDKDFHRAFDVEPGARLRLHHGDGEVTITPWDENVIDVKVRYHADVKAVGIGAKQDFDIEFDQDGDVVTVRGIEGSATGVYIVTRVIEYEYTYTIMAPSYVVIEATGDDGDVSVDGWRADIEWRMDDGDLEFSDIVNGKTALVVEDGDVRVESVESELTIRGDDGEVTISKSTLANCVLSLQDGDVVIIDSGGSFDVSLDDGDVTFSRVGASAVDIRGEDGDVRLDLAGSEEAQVTVSTDDGDVVVALPKGLSFEYLVTMDDGDVSIDLEGDVRVDTDEHRVSGRVGDGSGMIRVRVADGDVLLTSGD